MKGDLLHCPKCGKRHIDAGMLMQEPHIWHRCHFCQHFWRTDRPTIGTTENSRLSEFNRALGYYVGYMTALRDMGRRRRRKSSSRN